MAGTDIAIDLGSANFRLYVDGKGVVVDEPNVIAVDEDSNVWWPWAAARIKCLAERAIACAWSSP